MSIPKYDIISSGSKGNAVVINDSILIDCGVSLAALKPYIKNLRLVLLTHIHSDHFNPRTLAYLATIRPTLRFGCGKWLAYELIRCGVPKSNIDVFSPYVLYCYGALEVGMFPLTHNVPNCGYKLHFPASKVIYATDTNNLNGISAKDYDLYLIEANYEEEEIAERIQRKLENGEFSYETRARENHLSKEKCDDWLVRNMGAKSAFVYMHRHEERSKPQQESEKLVCCGVDKSSKNDII